MKVIYHVDAMEAWAMALGNVRNMLDWLQHNQKDYEIEVLANGPAVRGYLPGILSDSLYVIMAQAKAEGVVAELRDLFLLADGESLRRNDPAIIRWDRKSWISKGGSHYDESSAQRAVSSRS